ncbi:MAG: SH3 domain-containing protein [Aridibacter sp.]
MKSYIFILVCLFTLVFTTNAQESRWRKLTANDVLYDTETLKKTNNKVNVWIKYLEKDKSYKLVLTELDCNNFRLRRNQYISYNSNENVIDSSNITTTWQEIIPESNGEGYFDVFCKNEPDLESIYADGKKLSAEIDEVFNSENKVVFVSTKKANLRSLPSLEGIVIDTIPRGTKLLIKEIKGNWLLVSSDKYLAWIHNSTVSYSETKNAPPPERPKGVFVLGSSTDVCEEGKKAVIKADKTLFRQSPAGAAIMNLDQGRELTLLSGKSFNDYTWVSDNKTGLKGYILDDLLSKDCKSKTDIEPPPPLIFKVPQTTKKTPTDNDSFVSVYTGRNEKPSINIVNDTDRKMTLLFGGVKFVVPSQKNQQITVEGGNYEFTVSATGVRSLTGVKRFDRGYGYTWTFTIVTTRY